MHRTAATPPARPRVLAVVLGLLLAAATTPPLCGQGTFGTLPDPISGDDVDAYARRLGLSDEQRLAVDRLHETYLEDFRVLRETEIDEFVSGARDLMRSSMFNPDADLVRRSLATHERLVSRIAALDERFLGQLRGVLSEDQATALPRVRRQRDRTRQRTGLVRMLAFRNPGAQVDLGAMIDLLRLADADRQAADEALGEYETQLTSLTRRLADSTRAMFVEAVRRIEAEHGGTGRRNWAAISAIWAQTGRDTFGLAADISGLNRRTVRALGRVLAPPAAHRVTDTYRLVVYPDVQEGMAPTLSLFEAALAGDLNDELRAAVERAYAATRSANERLAEQMIDIHERDRRAGSLFPRRMGQDEGALEDLRRRREELNERAAAELFALLGAARAEAVRQRTATSDEQRKAEIDATLSALTPSGRAAGAARQAAARPASTVALDVAPISAGDVEAYAEQLGLDEGRAAVLRALHGDYLDAYRTIRAERIEPVLEGRGRLWDAGEKAAPPAANIDAWYEMRRAALDAVLELDRVFFEDIALTVIEPEDAREEALVPRLAEERRREVYRRATPAPRDAADGRFSRAWTMADNGEARVDVARLLGASSEDAIAPALEAYERDMTRLFRSRYELALTLARDIDRLRAAPEEGVRRRSTWREYQGLIESSGRAFADAEQAITAANRGLLAQLAGLLPASEHGALAEAYRREAFPEVYDDEASAEDALLEALAMNDLTEAQRQQIGELLATYRGEYRALCTRMTEIHAGLVDADTEASRPDWSRRREASSRLERLAFDRSELNGRTLRRLESTLTEEQASRLRD